MCRWYQIEGRTIAQRVLLAGVNGCFPINP